MAEMPSTPLQKTRDPWIDSIKGVLMIMVVLGHMLASVRGRYPVFLVGYTFINSFHMPAFLIISGFFMKRRVRERDYISIINKDIIPYFCAQILLFVACCLIPEGFRGASMDGLMSAKEFSLISPIYQLWYLGAIIIYFFIFTSFKPEKRPVLAMLCAIGISLALGFIPEIKVMRLSKSLGFMPFALFGYLLPDDTFKKLRKNRILPVISVLILAGYALFIYKTKQTYVHEDLFFFTSQYVTFIDKGFTLAYGFFGRLLFFVGATVLSFAFFCVIPRIKTPLAVIGQRSMYVFVLHAIPIVILRSLNYQLDIFNMMKTPLLKGLYVLTGIVTACLLASKPVYTVFSKFLEPKIDIRKIIAVLGGSRKEEKDQ